MALLLLACRPDPGLTTPEGTSALKPAATATVNGSVQSTSADKVLALSASGQASALASAPPPSKNGSPQAVAEQLAGRRPHSFGANAKGVVSRFAPRAREIALTIDLCDGKDERSYDNALFDLMAAEKIPATVFITGLWARHHTTELRWLTQQPLLEIANHGSRHKPCTVNGRSAFGIAGTRSLAEAIAEIDDNANLLEGMTGSRPRFYRSGTAHFDDVCAEAVQLLGEVPMGFSVAGDGGAGFDQAGVERALSTANPGAIVILHGHRPNRFAFEGLREALPTLRKRDISFVRLSEVSDRFEVR